MRLRSSTPRSARGLLGLPALLALLAVMGIVACNGVDSSSLHIIDLTVPERLTTVNGTAVPFGELFTVFDAGLAKSDSQVFSGGTMTFNSDGSFRLTYDVRNKVFVASQVSSDQTATVVWTGSWSLKGTALTLSFTDGGVARTVTGTVGDGFSDLTITSTVQTSATQTTTMTHALHYAIQ